MRGAPPALLVQNHNLLFIIELCAISAKCNYFYNPFQHRPSAVLYKAIGADEVSSQLNRLFTAGESSYSLSKAVVRGGG